MLIELDQTSSFRLQMGEIPILLHFQPHCPQYYYPILHSPHSSFFISIPKPRFKPNILKLKSFSTSWSYSDRVGEVPLLSEESGTSRGVPCKNSRKKRVFFLDVNPLCYKGCTPSLQSFAHWVSLFFSQVSLSDPVIAVWNLPLSSCCLFDFTLLKECVYVNTI